MWLLIHAGIKVNHVHDVSKRGPWSQHWFRMSDNGFIVTGRHQAFTCTNVDQNLWWHIRDHFVYVPSQWEMTLQCNVISHWLVTYIGWTHSRNDSCILDIMSSGLILGLRPANERRCYKVTPSLIGWAQTQNQPCELIHWGPVKCKCVTELGHHLFR